MSEDKIGLSEKERERLAGRPHEAVEMDFKAGVLAFAVLLLICAMIMGASLIVRSHASPPEAGPSAAGRPVGAAANQADPPNPPQALPEEAAEAAFALEEKEAESP